MADHAMSFSVRDENYQRFLSSQQWMIKSRLLMQQNTIYNFTMKGLRQGQKQIDVGAYMHKLAQAQKENQKEKREN